jgi:hypothetical protein
MKRVQTLATQNFFFLPSSTGVYVMIKKKRNNIILKEKYKEK